MVQKKLDLRMGSELEDMSMCRGVSNIHFWVIVPLQHQIIQKNIDIWIFLYQ